MPQNMRRTTHNTQSKSAEKSPFPQEFLDIVSKDAQKIQVYQQMYHLAQKTR